MRKLLLALGFWLGAVVAASAQCVAVGGVNSVPQVGVTCPSEPTTDTYGATAVQLAAVTGATDIACLTGSATRTVRVQRVRVSGTAGTLINVPILITKHASADTGGTPATGTALPVPYAFDSTDATVTATTTSWTANPTINDAAPGILGAQTLVLTATGTLAGNTGVTFDWDNRNFMEAITLRGIAQQLCVNLNATAMTSAVVNVFFSWTEAPQ